MIDEQFIRDLESGNPDTVAIAAKAVFPSSLRIRAQKALFAYALANPTEGQNALRRAAGLATRDSLQVEILPFLAIGLLKPLALKLLAQKGPFPTCSAPLRAAVLGILSKAHSKDPVSLEHGALALVAAVALGMKEAPEKIPGSLKGRKSQLLADLATLVRTWPLHESKSLYHAVVKALC